MNVAVGVILSLSAAFVWALSSVLSRISMRSITPLSLNALQLVFGAAFYVPVVLISRSVPSFSNEKWILLIGSGVWGYTIADWLFLAGIKSLGVSRATMLVTFHPVLTMFIAHYTLGRPLTAGLIAGALLIMLAVILVVSETGANGGVNWRGVACVISAQLMWTFAVIVTDWLVESSNPLAVAGLRIAFGALASGVFTGVVARDVRKLNKSGWMIILAITLLGMVLGQYFFTLALRFTGSSVATPLTESSPIMASVMAVLVLKERFTKRLAISMILTGVGISAIALFA